MKLSTLLLLFTPLSCMAAPAPSTTNTPVPTPVQQTPAVINCEYHFPKEANVINPTEIQAWSKSAALQSFRFNPSTLDAQLTTLKNCYTDQGWLGFNDALKKSGNLNAIKSKQLLVTSSIKGKVSLEASKDNQWKASLPIEVVYQNKEQKLTQSLRINLLITRKANGDLGIMQLIATPSKALSGTTGALKAPTTPPAQP